MVIFFPSMAFFSPFSQIKSGETKYEQPYISSLKATLKVVFNLSEVQFPILRNGNNTLTSKVCFTD